MSNFYIALVAETKPTSANDVEGGSCRQICAPSEFADALQTAISRAWSIEFFFSVYALKHDGSSVCVEDFRTLGEALEDWPDADISRVIAATGRDPSMLKLGSRVA